MTEPEPCPFCGHRPIILHKDAGFFKWFIECRGYHEYPQTQWCQMFYRTNRESVVKVWNRYVKRMNAQMKRNEERFERTRWKSEEEE